MHRKERQFRSWLLGELDKHSAVTFKEALNSGAFVTDSSPDTTRKYLRKLVSPEGPYKLERQKSCQYVVWKEECLAAKRQDEQLRAMTTEELQEMKNDLPN